MAGEATGSHALLITSCEVDPATDTEIPVVHIGLAAAGDRTRSLLGKVGTTLGVNLHMGNGRIVQPYVRAAYAHEFADNNQVRVNQNLFNNDLSGSRGEFGAGVAIQLADRLQAHPDLDYGKGDKIEQPWGANVGVRYSW
ncbi:autotransporter outer membrane beta-barrel domain-containing protein [Pseudomonas sp. CDFA 602]|nr:autotransporter outer membrane beta-barrel domain-containing protein [Pseudomonas californiensis]MCD5993625.1 autotransporter outer membrane beta-barrel domain-containing protein [Pseudomonas californiensis]MCD5999220.1 autotransporter outer membrane beta-barrel domain-containing protein [Pseudomonas californiensis]